MKAKNLLTLLLFSTCHVCFGQTKAPVDSTIIKKTDSLVRLAYSLWDVNLDSAETIAKYMLSYSEKNKHLRGIGQAYSTLGTIYQMKGDQVQCLIYYKKTAAIFEELGHELFLANVSYNIGVILIDDQEFEEALPYMQKAHELYLIHDKKKSGLGHTYMSIGSLYEKLNKPLTEVLDQFKEAEMIALSKNDTLLLVSIFNGRGEAFMKNNRNVPAALSSFLKANQLLQRSQPNNHFYMGYSYNLLSEAYYITEAYSKALVHNDNALYEYNTLHYLKGLRKTYENRKNILAKLGNFKEAFDAYELFTIYRDTLYQNDRRKEFRKLKTEYETEQLAAEKATAEAQVELAESKSNQNRNYLIAVIAIAILIFLISIFLLARLQARKKIELIAMELKEAQKRLALEKQYRESELKALKSQMNPHFIFNALNSIQEFIVTNKKDEASDYLSQFAGLIRTYLEHSDSGLISLTEEVESLTMYLDLEVMRFEDAFDYSISVSDTIAQDATYLPTMLIQPYVENAIKHGLLHKKGNKRLIVSFETLQKEMIQCVIEDNGVGRDKTRELQKSRNKWHKPFASKVTQERLGLLNYGKDKKIGVIIEDLTENEQAIGTRVTLTIPIGKRQTT
ncbi:MAG: histidine kinase [Ekhidna sp.]